MPKIFVTIATQPGKISKNYCLVVFNSRRTVALLRMQSDVRSAITIFGTLVFALVSNFMKHR